MDDEDVGRPTTKRTDVGYKRPPIEHQFKAGQKPPPRKKRADKPESMTQSLTRILREERRLKRGKKVVWLTNATLLVEVAFQLAEGSNSAVARALTGYLMAGDKPEVYGEQGRIEYDPDGKSGAFHYIVRRKV